MVNVTKAVIERDGKYLLLKRSSNSKFFPEQYDFPGGKIKEGETPEESTRRETKEESGLSIKIGKLLLEGDHIERGVNIHYRVFSILEFDGDISLSKDHSDYLWVEKEKIKEYLVTPFVQEYFKSL